MKVIFNFKFSYISERESKSISFSKRQTVDLQVKFVIFLDCPQIYLVLAAELPHGKRQCGLRFSSEGNILPS